ncbi:restriction endonuclease subunit S [Aliidiomarina haloalkalitolerans]|uniref:restriction endonuclease subunit S n=1 Tax=Aliidiomarina haloalkalitolerans TaxID=859059 RepID=UPI0018E54D7F|nr:restriction endonuclease subunit S [Aliidiomarina haloalkalitolerans]
MKSYHEYKKSNSRLTNKIPKDWREASLKRTVDGCINGIWGSEPDGKYDVACIRIADFDRAANSISTEKLTFRSVSYSERANRLIKRGDLLIEKSGGGDKTLVGAVAIFQHDFDAVTSNFVAKMRPRKGHSPEFLNYCFNALYSSNVNYCSIKQTTGIQNLDSEAYLQERIGVPSYPEQQKIAQFLDYETAKIDALIYEQKRLIELLREKRQAVISHAVTKGLNPDVPMKDSGVEWIGQIPEHWHTLPIKYVINSFEQGWSPQCFNEPVSDESELGVLKVGCVRHGRFIHEENKRLPPGLPFKNELSVRAGDLLISRANTRELVGSVGVPSVNHENLMISDKIFRLRLNSQALPEFLCFFLTTGVARQQIELAATGASDSMLNIGQSTIKEMPFPCPPMEEQHQIVEKVVKANWKLLELAGEAIKLVEKLKERRSALISAAVTGKIDVRDWQPPQGSDTVEKKN